MTSRAFAPWVEPVAAELRETRSQIVRRANQMPEEVWALPSPLPEWSYKDLLAHLATGDWFFQTMLREALGLEKGMPDEDAMSFVDDGNARRIGDRKETPISALIAEVEAERKETQELLGRITNAIDPGAVVWHRSAGEPVTLEQWMAGFPRHDRDHLAQLETAMQNVMM